MNCFVEFTTKCQNLTKALCASVVDHVFLQYFVGKGWSFCVSFQCGHKYVFMKKDKLQFHLNLSQVIRNRDENVFVTFATV